MVERRKPLPKEIVIPPPYTLTDEDFAGELPKMTEWEYPQKVLRSNFVPYTVKVFGFSQGMPLIHRMYMNLIQRRTGFDGYCANSAFAKAGGWDVLSEEEHAYFEQAFESVFRHGSVNRYEQGSRYKNVGEELLDNLPYKRMQGVVNNTRYERPADYDAPDEQILAYLRELRRSEQYYRSLQID